MTILDNYRQNLFMLGWPPIPKEKNPKRRAKNQNPRKITSPHFPSFKFSEKNLFKGNRCRVLQIWRLTALPDMQPMIKFLQPSSLLIPLIKYVRQVKVSIPLDGFSCVKRMDEKTKYALERKMVSMVVAVTYSLRVRAAENILLSSNLFVRPSFG